MLSFVSLKRKASHCFPFLFTRERSPYRQSENLKTGVVTDVDRREVGGATAVNRRASAAIGSRRIQSALVIRDQPVQSAFVSERVRRLSIVRTRKRDATASVCEQMKMA